VGISVTRWAAGLDIGDKLDREIPVDNFYHLLIISAQNIVLSIIFIELNVGF
jgi:hypothetical protein